MAGLCERAARSREVRSGARFPGASTFHPARYDLSLIVLQTAGVSAHRNGRIFVRNEEACGHGRLGMPNAGRRAENNASRQDCLGRAAARAGIALNLCANWREMDAPSQGAARRRRWNISAVVERSQQRSTRPLVDRWPSGFWRRKQPDLCNQNQYRPTGGAIFIFRRGRCHRSSFRSRHRRRTSESRLNRPSMAAIIILTN